MEFLIELPEELKAVLAVLITVVVTQALKFLSEKLGFDLSGYSAKVTAALVAAALALVNGALSNIPAEFAPIATQLLALLVVVLASFGAYREFVKPKAKG